MKPFYERYWNRDAELEDFHYKWPAIKRFIPTSAKLKILDFGCGKGKILREMMQINPDASYAGVDVSETGLKAAKQTVKGAEFHVIIDGGEIPYKNETFDFITALDVLEHVYDTENAFGELSRVLKPDGTILISVPFNGLIKNLLIVLFYYEFIYNPYSPHIRFFTKKSMQKCLTNAGLSAQRFGYYGRFYPLSSGMYVIAKK